MGDGPHTRVVLSARTVGPELASGPEWLAAACYGRGHRLAGCITQDNHCSCRCSTEAPDLPGVDLCVGDTCLGEVEGEQAWAGVHEGLG